MESVLQYLAVILGFVAFCYPLWAYVQFRRTTQLGDAVALVYLGEAAIILISFSVVIFVALKFITNIDGAMLQLMRCTLFTITIATNVHLKNAVVKVQRGKRPSKPSV